MFNALIDVPETVRSALGHHLVDFSHMVDDLSEIPDDRLRARACTALMTLATLSFKHAQTRSELLDRMAGWSDVMRAAIAAPHGLEALALVMRNIVQASDVERDAIHSLMKRELGPEAKDIIMTLENDSSSEE
ncbi:MAG TPA: hypothetical protein VH165_04845 [Kofleriaceae bacterium]|nr:hypothetical protein [Kofleriaceae bacterium]